ncbi:hypothetical protein [Streptomyces sp. NPDC059575]|uniref:hypothetical protein n=1 Tax=Streptomyces sp. NPDC059575 TaxID=3346872 RepID=UPI0036B9C83C
MRGVSLAVSVIAACCAVGGWGASAGAAEASGPSDSSPARQATAYPGELRCYATRRDPGTVRCYRLSAKAEFRHGEIVYVPILVQVPVPPRPPSVTVVGSLNDIRPGAPGASAPGG